MPSDRIVTARDGLKEIEHDNGASRLQDSTAFGQRLREFGYIAESEAADDGVHAVVFQREIPSIGTDDVDRFSFFDFA